eukprot:snap_masked-scaffold_9-processed-gene-6.21-mRNA-1 protein AED:1.00 eAED:1.00 QI:0/0/0/0/1/1/2/0/67
MRRIRLWKRKINLIYLEISCVIFLLNIFYFFGIKNKRMAIPEFTSEIPSPKITDELVHEANCTKARL